jgi:hypothetical protein
MTSEEQQILWFLVGTVIGVPLGRLAFELFMYWRYTRHD